MRLFSALSSYRLMPSCCILFKAIWCFLAEEGAVRAWLSDSRCPGMLVEWPQWHFRRETSCCCKVNKKIQSAIDEKLVHSCKFCSVGLISKDVESSSLKAWSWCWWKTVSLPKDPQRKISKSILVDDIEVRSNDGCGLKIHQKIGFEF